MRKNELNITNLPMIHATIHEAPKSVSDQSKDVGWKAAAAGATALTAVVATWLGKKIFKDKPQVTETHVYNHDVSDENPAAIAADAIEKAEASATTETKSDKK